MRFRASGVKHADRSCVHESAGEFAHAVKAEKSGRAHKITVSCQQNGCTNLRVTCRDNGTGVAAANLPKLLDPFFTTKAPGEGMGLGLSICHTIVKNHGGTIHIDSEAGSVDRSELRSPLASLQHGARHEHATARSQASTPCSTSMTKSRPLKYFRKGLDKDFRVLTATACARSDGDPRTGSRRDRRRDYRPADARARAAWNCSPRCASAGRPSCAS